ncbi:MAG TPA: class I SAM-dependent methyltransferase [Brumimicrobium sp.]|nr:class I SAM-dependent methyltransferase [Brumimicrobium sp.]
MNTKKAREQIFRHLDGVVTVPVTLALKRRGVLDEIKEKEKVNLDVLSNEFKANKGYLNVALRVLASQGFIEYEVNNATDEVHLSKNKNTDAFLDAIHWYELVSDLIKSYDVEDFMGKEANGHHPVFNVLKKFTEEEAVVENASEIEQQMIKHTEGYLMSPMIVKLGMSGMFHKYFMESSFSAEEFHQHPEDFKKILDFFAERKWFVKQNGHYQFTEEGLFFAKRASAYGVTVSYLPIFLQIDELLFGEAGKLRENQENSDEIHVDRVMNVWGSGGAHTTYFKVLDDFIIEIFNRPIEEQPKGILDMGCGNGALLYHLYETIEKRTLRGKKLEEYPLFLVGADYNEAALKITRANLIANDIWAKVIWGDIGNPDLLAEDLKTNYNIELEDLLNMRTFLDHNRVWEEPGDSGKLISNSTGAFAHRGQWLSNNKVELSLQKHFEKWKPYVSKNGLILIELHTVDPKTTAKNIGKTPATAYDATHGFSDQYIVEIEVFQKAAKAAGLIRDEKMFRKFPNTEYATVSINYLN